jgi:hypothetical protein
MANGRNTTRVVPSRYGGLELGRYRGPWPPLPRAPPLADQEDKQKNIRLIRLRLCLHLHSSKRQIRYTRRTWVIGFQGAWIWVRDKAEIRRHITHMASISNAVMRPRTGDLEAKNSGATGVTTRCTKEL